MGKESKEEITVSKRSDVSRIVQLVDSMPEPRSNLRKRKDHNNLIKDDNYKGAPTAKRRKIDVDEFKSIEGLVS